MSRYLFHTHQVKHCFCSLCGIQVFEEGSENGEPMFAVNVRCLQGVDSDCVPIERFDGRAL